MFMVGPLSPRSNQDETSMIKAASADRERCEEKFMYRWGRRAYQGE
jgi:hypothetical protein